MKPLWPPTILVADNNTTYVNTLKDLLEHDGFRVLAASDVNHARELLESDLVNVAVLDMRLNDDLDERDISGLELAKINEEIPKIVISGYPTHEVVRQAVGGSLGSPPAVNFISKAEGADRLLESIRRLADTGRLARSASTSDRTPVSVIEPSTSPRPLRVFLCHSSDNKPVARSLYHQFKSYGIDLWLDEYKLLPGQDWQIEIEKAVRKSDMVIVCLSRASISKRGYVQKEIRIALDVADEQPEGTIFIVPLRIEECEIPDRLRKWQWVNYFEEDAFEKLLLSMKHRASEISALASNRSH